MNSSINGWQEKGTDRAKQEQLSTTTTKPTASAAREVDKDKIRLTGETSRRWHQIDWIGFYFSFEDLSIYIYLSLSLPSSVIAGVVFPHVTLWSIIHINLICSTSLSNSYTALSILLITITTLLTAFSTVLARYQPWTATLAMRNQ